MQLSGLSSSEVQERISQGLQNKSSKPKSKTISQIFVENVFSVFNIVIFSVVIFLLYFYFKTGDSRLILDCLGIFTIAVVNTFLAVSQEIKAKRALDKVNLLLKREVTVIRNGSEVSVEPEDIVKDDIIKILRGDQIAVDGIIIFSNHLEIDESLLTGESNPIHKKEGEEVLSGSFCLSGNGFYKAEKIGEESFAAKVTSTAKKYKFSRTPLQKKINRIVQVLFALAIVLVILEIVLNKDGFTVDFVRKISTILISLVPQGLVLMSTVTFAVGVWRISKLGAIIQKLNAIESFSNLQVVCMDKTGTLTQNKLSVHKIITLDSGVSQEETESLLGVYADLTSDKNATINAISIYKPGKIYSLVDEIPFSSERKLSLIKAKKDGKVTTFILGAYDSLCSFIDEKNKSAAGVLFNENKLSVYRNLLFGIIDDNTSEEKFSGIPDSFSISPICIISITDKIRDDVFDAIKLFENNGIKIKILSGDSSKAIQEVAAEIGWKIEDKDLISGSELDKLSRDEFDKAVTEKIIFARLKPDNKLNIIRSLRDKKIYTAMIGDGVNDLPAIKESDMGIAMEEGSGITKEVADIVLLQNKFSLLPEIFNEGNKIVNSVKSVSKLFLTKNFFVIYITLLSLFFFLEFPLTPRRVSLINIFGIGLPAFIITLKNLNTQKTLHFMKDVFTFVILSALIIVAAGYIGVYYVGKMHIATEKEMEMVMLTIMIITNIANYFSIVLKKDDDNKLTYLLYGFLILALYIFFAATRINSWIILLIKDFYEIDYVRPELWWLIMTISLISSIVLFLAQKLRAKLVN